MRRQIECVSYPSQHHQRRQNYQNLGSHHTISEQLCDTPEERPRHISTIVVIHQIHILYHRKIEQSRQQNNHSKIYLKPCSHHLSSPQNQHTCHACHQKERQNTHFTKSHCQMLIEKIHHRRALASHEKSEKIQKSKSSHYPAHSLSRDNKSFCLTPSSPSPCGRRSPFSSCSHNTFYKNIKTTP